MDICETILPLIFLALVFNCSIQTFESPGWKEVPFSEILNSFWIKTRHKKAAYPSNFPLFSRFNFEMSIQKKLPYDYGGFQKWWYPQVIHFNRVFHYKPSIFGYPNFWKPPYLCMLEILILRWWLAGTSWHLWLPSWTRTTISFHLIFFESQLKLDGPRFSIDSFRIEHIIYSFQALSEYVWQLDLYSPLHIISYHPSIRSFHFSFCNSTNCCVLPHSILFFDTTLRIFSSKVKGDP